MKKIANIQYLLILVLGALLVATIFSAVKAGGKGNKLAILAEEAETLQNENQDLKNSLVMSSSLVRIAKVASGAGMITPENFIYVNGNGVAMRGINQVASLQ